MRILLLSAYDAVSHRRWREGLVAAFPEHEWTVLTLPPRHFAWRIRGNSLSWAVGEREALEQGYDVVMATSMVDLAALRGMVPTLAAVPAVYYFHENQFAYPVSDPAHDRVEPKVVNLYGALAAERVLFNSEYNRDTFLDGVRDLLRRMPDAVPAGVVDALVARSEVVPVPLADDWFVGDDADGPLTLLWPHRWEYDKAPGRFFAALERLVERSVDFRVHVLGQQFRDSPAVFERARERLGNRIGEWGVITDPERYRAVLRTSHVVVSTALHDFQGLAMLEAMAAGCVPAAPDRLAYRDFIPADHRWPSTPHDPEAEAAALADHLTDLARAHATGGLPPAPGLDHLRWAHLRPAYAAALEGVARAPDSDPRGEA